MRRVNENTIMRWGSCRTAMSKRPNVPCFGSVSASWGNGAVIPAKRRIAKMTYTLCVTYINASCGV